MTQIYYVQHLLPVYAKEVSDARLMHDRMGVLQEDNDNSHGTRSKDNVVVRYKEANWIPTLIHPPQSPDLNPIEAVWNLLKQRIKQRQWRTMAELKKVVLDEWDKISLDEIGERIAEIPDRCKKLIATGGMPIKSALW